MRVSSFFHLYFEGNTIYFIPKKFIVADIVVAIKNASKYDVFVKVNIYNTVSFVTTLTTSVKIYNKLKIINLPMN